MSSSSNNSLPTPVENMSLADGRQELPTCLRMQQSDPDRAVEIMTRFPSLAKEGFPFSPGIPLAHPLLHMVRSQPNNLEIIRKIFELYPAAIRELDGLCILFVLRHDETLLYLLKRDPDVLTMEQAGTTMIHHIVGAKYRTRRLILEHFPHLHGLKDDRGRHLLNCCMYSEDDSEDPEFVKYLAAKFPSDVSTLSFARDLVGFSYNPAFIGDFQMDTILRIVPQLTELDLTCVAWEDGAMELFLNALKDCQSVKKLSFLADRQVFGENTTLHELLEQSLAANKSIRLLTLLGAVPRGYEYLVQSQAISYSNALFNTLLKGVAKMQSLDTLELQHFSIRDSQSLLRFMADGGAPRSLSLVDVAIAGNSPSGPPSWEKSRLEYFSLEDTFLRPTLVIRRGALSTEHLLNQLCQEISKAPNLSEVRLCCGGQPDSEFAKNMTQGVLKLLQNPTLDTLSLFNTTVDTDQVSEALMENNNLMVLRVGPYFAGKKDQSLLVNVLKNYNTTLSTVEIFDPPVWGKCDGKLVQEIGYWTYLNSHGRNEARDTGTTSLKFLGLLLNAMAVPEEEDDDHAVHLNGLRSFNCQYGLLRELPSLWSAWPTVVRSAGQKKRKRSHD